MGDEHAATALPPTLFQLKNLTPSKLASPTSTSPTSISSESETPMAAPQTVTPAASPSQPNELHAAENPTPTNTCDAPAEAVPTKAAPHNAPISASPRSSAASIASEIFVSSESPAKTNAPTVTLADQSNSRNWQQMISANALVIAMLLLVIVFAVKVSRRATESTSEPAIADSQISDLLPPEDLVVFADENLGTESARHEKTKPATPPAAKANAALMAPESPSAKIAAAEVDVPAPKDDPKLSAGTPANTVSAPGGIDPAIAALNATVHSHKAPTSNVSTSTPQPTSAASPNGTVNASQPLHSDLPDLSAAKPTSINASAPSTPQESATPRGISNWEQYLPSQPTAN
ncbi:hypothetical protein RMSM_07612 [Rhodopirellula maiorica SM1]|uniref:Uncharacterized protein n=2 Tax=Novipirellula TaxID=2795426 RepID=M5R7V3_9BACT|nr:hypothetical protein RMSM_07612 [Rhodopirellula maiorica SM1]